MSDQHSPLPWNGHNGFAGQDPGVYYIRDAANRIVARTLNEERHPGADLRALSPHRTDMGQPNSEFIVRAVNSHEALVKAAENALSYLRVCHLANHAGAQIKVDQAIETLQVALKLAKGE